MAVKEGGEPLLKTVRALRAGGSPRGISPPRGGSPLSTYNDTFSGQPHGSMDLDAESLGLPSPFSYLLVRPNMVPWDGASRTFPLLLHLGFRLLSQPHSRTSQTQWCNLGWHEAEFFES